MALPSLASPGTLAFVAVPAGGGSPRQSGWEEVAWDGPFLSPRSKEPVSPPAVAWCSTSRQGKLESNVV